MIDSTSPTPSELLSLSSVTPENLQFDSDLVFTDEPQNFGNLEVPFASQEFGQLYQSMTLGTSSAVDTPLSVDQVLNKPVSSLSLTSEMINVIDSSQTNEVQAIAQKLLAQAEIPKDDELIPAITCIPKNPKLTEVLSSTLIQYNSNLTKPLAPQSSASDSYAAEIHNKRLYVRFQSIQSNALAISALVSDEHGNTIRSTHISPAFIDRLTNNIALRTNDFSEFNGLVHVPMDYMDPIVVGSNQREVTQLAGFEAPLPKSFTTQTSNTRRASAGGPVSAATGRASAGGPSSAATRRASGSGVVSALIERSMRMRAASYPTLTSSNSNTT